MEAVAADVREIVDGWSAEDIVIDSDDDSDDAEEDDELTEQNWRQIITNDPAVIGILSQRDGTMVHILTVLTRK